jgi:N-acylneuraminate cytidylyltransferase
MNVALIPVRGGSKSIPLKNIKKLNGRPLVYWVIKAACECDAIDRVYVSTDSEEIRETVEEFQRGAEAKLFEKAAVIGRSKESATDTASTEFVMLEFSKEYSFDNIVLIQATSPLLQGTDLDRGFEIFAQENTDSVLSVVKQKRFHWGLDEKGNAFSSNYDVYHRPRRQEFEGYYVENGAFYITSRENLLQSGNRVSGNIKLVEMDADTFVEIDEESDWMIVEALMKKKGMRVSLPDLSAIKVFLTDCDGCLTDAGMYYSEQGDELKKFNTKDGMGFQMLRKQGILTGIITGEERSLNRRRAEKLHIDILEQGCHDKVAVMKKICETYQLEWSNILFIGDDVNDLEALQRVGFACCPKDAVDAVRTACDYVTEKKGGEGVIREVAELLLRK